MEFTKLVDVYEALEGISKRLVKTGIITGFLESLDEKSLEPALLLLEGRLFPPWKPHKLGVSSKIVVKAISLATGKSSSDIENLWRQEGDLGRVAQSLAGKSSQQTLFAKSLTINNVFEDLKKLSEMEGKGAVQQRLQIIQSLLNNANETECKYIARLCIGDLRVGVGRGVIRDAIACTYFWDQLSEEAKPNLTKDAGLAEYGKQIAKLLDANKDKSSYQETTGKIQTAYDVSNDFHIVALAAIKSMDEVEKIKLDILKPINVMLAQKVTDIDEGFEKCGQPMVAEFKYDGFRIQLHKRGSEIQLFTRRLENVTNQFPDVVELARTAISAKDALLDGEIVGVNPDGDGYLPFQQISQRIRRKYDIEEIAKKFPVELVVFDILHKDGDDLLNKTYKERYGNLASSIKTQPGIKIAEHIETTSKDEVQALFAKAIEQGMEGLMFKNFEGIYQPGSRVGTMVKYKQAMDPIDLVIVGAEWGEGKRSGWMTSFNLACQSEDGELLEIGKVGTGFKELDQEDDEGVTFKQLTEALQPNITEETGREVRVSPTVVLEIMFEEIQKSPTYSSGYALRFPRVVQIRDDRGIESIATIHQIEDEYRKQNKTSIDSSTTIS